MLAHSQHSLINKGPFLRILAMLFNEASDQTMIGYQRTMEQNRTMICNTKNKKIVKQESQTQNYTKYLLFSQYLNSLSSSESCYFLFFNYNLFISFNLSFFILFRLFRLFIKFMKYTLCQNNIIKNSVIHIQEDPGYFLAIDKKIMNFQTYQQCIQSLQKQIKSREQQRKQMEFTIQSLDKQVTDEIKKNKSLKEQVNYVMKNNESLVMQLHAREQMIQSQRVQLKSAQTGDEFMRQKNLMLQTQKKNFEQQLNQRDEIIKETNRRVRELQVEVKKNESLVEGYRNIVNEKAKEVARLETIARQAQTHKDKTVRQLSKVRELFQAEKNEMEFRIQHSQGTVEQTLSEFQSREAELLEQLADLKELHSNQLSTMRFNYAQEIKELQNETAALKKDVLHYIQHIDQLKEHDKEVKRQFDAQTHNKDDVIKQLLNEINFLKSQKVQLQHNTQTQIQQLTQKIHKVQLQTSVHVENTTKLEEQTLNKVELIQKLKIQLQILNQQTKHYQTLLEEEKDHSFKKGEQIFQLKSQLEKVTKKVQTLKKQKEFTTNNTSKELTFLRNKNIDLERSLLTAQSQLHEQKIRIVELEEKIKELTYERYSTTQTKSELIETIQNHETTISNLQTMLQQSKKLITELNSMMKFKLQEIDTLQQSNTMFRTEKMEWLRNEEDYRRKIVQLRNVSWGNVVIRKNTAPNTNGDTSLNTVRTTHRANTEFHKMSSQSILSSPGGHNRFPFSGSISGGTPKHNPKRKTINPHNWFQRLHGYDQQDSINPKFPSSSSNEDFSISIPQIQEPPTYSNAYRQQSKNKKIKTSQSHEVNEEISTQPMKKKEKRHQFVGENAQNKVGLRKDYSVGMIKAVIEKQQ